MTTEAHPGARRSGGVDVGIGASNGTQAIIRRAGRAGIGTVVAVAIVAFSLLWMAAESHYRSCIEQANANYPAVAVSALNGQTTGPLKLSFVNERQAAVKKCHRI